MQFVCLRVIDYCNSYCSYCFYVMQRGKCAFCVINVVNDPGYYLACYGNYTEVRYRCLRWDKVVGMERKRKT